MSKRDDFMQGGGVQLVLGPEKCTSVRVSSSLVKVIDRGFSPIAKGENDNVSPDKRLLNQYINPLSPKIQKGMEM